MRFRFLACAGNPLNRYLEMPTVPATAKVMTIVRGSMDEMPTLPAAVKASCAGSW